MTRQVDERDKGNAKKKAALKKALGKSTQDGRQMTRKGLDGVAKRTTGDKRKENKPYGDKHDSKRWNSEKEIEDGKYELRSKRNQKKWAVSEEAGEFQVGDVVIALKGPHKGDKHKVIHCFDDGSCNIKPLTHRVKYRMGAAKAQPGDIEMATDEAKMSSAHKKIARDVHDVDKRDEPMAAGPGATQKANRNMLIRKYGKDWRKHAGITEGTNLTEGVLDEMDDDGFMAKRQLYDLAKYSVQLHKMIQDDDNLEPWIQAKITKAADYIDTVKHYLEYQGVRGAEDAAIDFGMDDIADVDTQIATLEPEVEPELDTDVTTIRPAESVETEVRESSALDGPRGTPEEIMARMFAPLKDRK